MIRTIQITEHISAQGVLVRLLDGGQALIQDGKRFFQGRLIE